MNQDLIQLISYYLDIDDFYQFKKLLELDINLYLKYVKCPIESEKTYIASMLSRMCTLGESPYINWASANGYLEVLKYLISKQPPNQVYDIPLHNASKMGHLEIVKYFDRELKYFDPNTLTCAVNDDHVEVVKYLYEEGKGENNMDDVFFDSVRFGAWNTVKYLESKGEIMRGRFNIVDSLKITGSNAFVDLNQLKNLDQYLGENKLGEFLDEIKSKLIFPKTIKDIITEYII